MEFPRRGSVYFVSLDPVIGSETGKSRPAVIISNDRNNEFSDTITVIPLSSQVKKVFPFEARIPGKEAGLNFDSKAKCNQVRTIDKRRLERFLGDLSRSRVKEIEDALEIHLAFEIQ